MLESPRQKVKHTQGPAGCQVWVKVAKETKNGEDCRLYLEVSTFKCYQTLCRHTKRMGPWITSFSPDLSKPRLAEGDKDTPRHSDFPRLVAEWGLEGLPRAHELLSGGDLHPPRGALDRFSRRGHILEGAGCYPTWPPQSHWGFYALLQLRCSHGIFIGILWGGGGKGISVPMCR